MRHHQNTGAHRIRGRAIGLVTSAVVLISGLATMAVTLVQPAAADPSPAPAGTGQIITVNAPTGTSTTATLTAWSRGSDGIWRIAIGPVPAYVGIQGIGKASESSGRTPAGAFALTQAFGRQSNPGTRLAYFKTDPLDWWDENPSSPSYNLHVRQANSPGGNSENLYYAGSVYDYAVNMNYNLARVPGAGSAFFLHVTNGRPTAGCVAVPQATMISILRWLDPAQHPYIYNKVGAAWKPPAPRALFGQVDTLAAIGSRQVDVEGWALNSADQKAGMRIAVGVDDAAGWKYTWDTTRFARPDVVRVYPGALATSGFKMHVSSTAGMKLVCVYEVVPVTAQAKLMACHHLQF